jgi:hypothetical protein
MAYLYKSTPVKREVCHGKNKIDLGLVTIGDVVSGNLVGEADVSLEAFVGVEMRFVYKGIVRETIVVGASLDVVASGIRVYNGLGCDTSESCGKTYTDVTSVGDRTGTKILVATYLLKDRYKDDACGSRNCGLGSYSRSAYSEIGQLYVWINFNGNEYVFLRAVRSENILQPGEVIVNNVRSGGQTNITEMCIAAEATTTEITIDGTRLCVCNQCKKTYRLDGTRLKMRAFGVDYFVDLMCSGGNAKVNVSVGGEVVEYMAECGDRGIVKGVEAWVEGEEESLVKGILIRGSEVIYIRGVEDLTRINLIEYNINSLAAQADIARDMYSRKMVSASDYSIILQATFRDIPGYYRPQGQMYGLTSNLTCEGSNPVCYGMVVKEGECFTARVSLSTEEAISNWVRVREEGKDCKVKVSCSGGSYRGLARINLNYSEGCSGSGVLTLKVGGTESTYKLQSTYSTTVDASLPAPKDNISLILYGLTWEGKQSSGIMFCNMTILNIPEDTYIYNYTNTTEEVIGVAIKTVDVSKLNEANGNLSVSSFLIALLLGALTGLVLRLIWKSLRSRANGAQKG